MIKFIATLLVVSGAFFIFQQATNAEISQASKLTVVELFTSQSCSSCPPADKLLTEISDDPNMITLGFHVTYWDHLHWKDTLSREFATKRQRNYAGYKNTGRVYTPQMIVNGGAEFVGSSRGKLQSAVNKSKPVQPIAITVKNGQIELDLPALPKSEQGDFTLWVYGTQAMHTQPIKSGENRGRTVTYANSVLTQKRGDRWDGTARIITLDALESEGLDGITIIAQRDSFGTIVAAGKSAL